jgi:hypothetical protein
MTQVLDGDHGHGDDMVAGEQRAVAVVRLSFEGRYPVQKEESLCRG